MVTAGKNNELSDSEIVKLALKSSEYFAVIVDRYEEKITRYMRRIGVHSFEDRQDVLQDIFIKVYKNLNGFDDSFSFSSWIYRIAHNEAISLYRKKIVRPEGHLVEDSDTAMLFMSDTNISQEMEFDMQINSVSLQQALRQLDIKYRDALILRFFEHKEYDEISDILKIPTGTVGTLISRGKNKLKLLLQNTKHF
jgi:RNA polymerase sigma-70 factor (ECF subfamily)